MHYFERETIMSMDNALALKPKEVLVLEHVRTYEYEQEESLPYFVEIKCRGQEVLVRKHRILDFPNHELEKELIFPSIDLAIEVFQQWIQEIPRTSTDE